MSIEYTDKTVRVTGQDGECCEFPNVDHNEEYELLRRLALCVRLMIHCHDHGLLYERDKYLSELRKRVEGIFNPVYGESGNRIPYVGGNHNELKDVVHFFRNSYK